MDRRRNRAHEGAFQGYPLVVQQALDRAVRRMRLSADDADDFRGWAALKLLENECAAPLAHGGKANHTYLVSVARNLAIDYQRKCWGRFRPSVQATRLGTVAVQLERLLYRDGWTLSEAAGHIRTPFGRPVPEAELARIYRELPRRRVPRMHVDVESAGLSTTGGVQKRAKSSEGTGLVAQIQASLRSTLAQLKPEDRELLGAVYLRGRTVASISRETGACQRQLYRRIEKALSRLRQGLVAAGVRFQDLCEVIDLGAHSLALTTSTFQEQGEAAGD